MLAGGFIYALMVLAGWLAYQYLGLDTAVYLAVGTVSLILGGLLYLLLISIAPNLYRSIEI